jgi:hypothetical protein
MRSVFRIAGLFAWLLVPLVIWLLIAVWGTPHVILSYTYSGGGGRYAPPAARRYITCSYAGWTGWQTVPAKHGRCPWVQIFKGSAR